MSEVQKYDPFGYDGLSALMHEDEHGDWVRLESYEAIKLQRDALLAQHGRDSAELRSLCAARDQYRDLSIKYGGKLSEVLKEKDAALNQAEKLEAGIPRLVESNYRNRQALNTAIQLLAKCQEHLDPHRDAVLWGEVYDALKVKP